MKLVLFAIFALTSSAVYAQETQVSYMPKTGLPMYIFEKLDLTSFRSSFGPKRSPGQRHFADLGLKPTKLTNNLLAIETDDWLYEVEILRVADVNGDKLTDLEVCFRDKSKTASYNTQQPLLLSQLEKSGQLVAIHFQVSGCEAYAR
jgi:hypothetical protein